MGCGCGGGTEWYYRYELAQEDGSTQEFDGLDAARVAQAAQGGVIRTVRLQQTLSA